MSLAMFASLNDSENSRASPGLGSTSRMVIASSIGGDIHLFGSSRKRSTRVSKLNVLVCSLLSTGDGVATERIGQADHATGPSSRWHESNRSSPAGRRSRRERSRRRSRASHRGTVPPCKRRHRTRSARRVRDTPGGRRGRSRRSRDRVEPSACADTSFATRTPRRPFVGGSVRFPDSRPEPRTEAFRSSERPRAERCVGVVARRRRPSGSDLVGFIGSISRIGFVAARAPISPSTLNRNVASSVETSPSSS